MKFIFDIDDTLFTTNVNATGKYEKIISVNTALINKVKKLYEDGHVIILQTGRHWNFLSLTLIQLERFDVKYDTLIMGQFPADYIVNDKSIRPDEFLNMEF